MTLLINRRIRPNMDDYILFRRQKSSGHYLLGINANQYLTLIHLF